MIAPDFAEPIVAWRTWRIVRRGDTLRLASVVQATIWEPNQEAIGECLPLRRFRIPRLRRREHHTPDASCTCGIYASTRVDVAGRYAFSRQFAVSDGGARVIGLVSLWGRVVACTHGWRAEFAYPRRIFIPQRVRGRDRRLEDVAFELTEYGVPIEVVSYRSERDFVRALA